MLCGFSLIRQDSAGRRGSFLERLMVIPRGRACYESVMARTRQETMPRSVSPRYVSAIYHPIKPTCVRRRPDEWGNIQPVTSHRAYGQEKEDII